MLLHRGQHCKPRTRCLRRRRVRTKGPICHQSIDENSRCEPVAPPARQESRARVLGLLRKAGRPLGISALTESTGLSAGAVRFHLANLLRAGSVRTVLAPTHTRPGRPVINELTEEHDAVVALIRSAGEHQAAGRVSETARICRQISEVLCAHTIVEEQGLFPELYAEFPEHLDVLIDLIMWGSNLPVTRTPDAHWMTEAR